MVQHKNVQRLDRSELEKPIREANGWMRVDGFVARTGIQTYARADGTVWNEYRPSEEVFDAEALKSFGLVPLTNNHPGVGLLDAHNTRNYQVGAVALPEKNGDKARTRMLITDAAAVAAVESGRVQLSCGYTCDLDVTPGDFQGQRYDAVQRNIRGNHVALVDRARGGEQLRLRADSMNVQIPVQVEQKNHSELEPSRMEKIRCAGCGNMVFADDDGDCPSCGYDLDKDPEVKKDHAMKFQELEAKVATLTAQVELQKLKADEAEKKAEKASARADAAEAEAKKLKGDHSPDSIAKAVTARVALERSASAILGSAIKIDGLKDAEIKKLVAEQVNGVKLDGKSEVYVDAAYEIALKRHEDEPGAIARAQERADVASFDDVARADAEGVEAESVAYNKRMREAHVRK